MAKIIKEINFQITDDGKIKQVTKDIENLNKAQNKQNKSSQTVDRNLKGNAAMSANASKNFSKQAQGMNGVLVPAYAEVAARVFALTAAFGALSRAADYNILMKGQEAYAERTGKNMGNIAREIQKASKHMLSFGEASKSAALASTAGLASTQIGRMTKAALDASAALGRNMTDSMDRLTRGIVKAEPEILDEVGIIIRLDRVYKDYAESMNKTTAELSEFEKLQARTNAILGQAEKKFGGIADNLPANTFEKLAASFSDLINKGGALIATVLTPLVDALADSKTALMLLMATITKNLIGKIFPAFTNFGAKFDKFNKRLSTFGESAGAYGQSLSEKLLGKKGELAKSREVFGQGFESMGKIAGSDLEKFMAEGFKKGDKLTKEVQSRINSVLGAGLRSASRNADGISSVGRTKGMSRKELSRLRNEFNKIVKLQDDISKSKWGAAIAGGASVAVAAVSRVTAAMTTSIGSLGNLVGSITSSVNQGLGMVGTLAEGWRAVFKPNIQTSSALNQDLFNQNN